MVEVECRREHVTRRRRVEVEEVKERRRTWRGIKVKSTERKAVSGD